MPTPKIRKQTFKTHGPHVGGGGERLDTNMRKTKDITRTSTNTDTQCCYSACETTQWRQKWAHHQTRQSHFSPGSNNSTTPIMPCKKKLSIDTTTQTQIIHATCHKYIDYDSLPTTKPSSYETITTHPSMGRRNTKRRRATHQEDTYMAPNDNIHRI